MGRKSSPTLLFSSLLTDITTAVKMKSSATERIYVMMAQPIRNDTNVF